MKCIGCVVLAFAGLLAFASGATAQTATLHERTVQIPGTSCSVTAWDYFTTVDGVYKMQYGGGTSCAGNVGQKTLDVVPQVFNLVNGQPLWFSIGGDGLFQGPTPASPLRLSGSRTAVQSHLYRLLAYGYVLLPNGKSGSVTVCADCQGTQPSLSILPPSGFVYTLPLVIVQIPGVSCSLIVDETRFPYINGTPVMQYGAELSCAAGVTGQKRLEIQAQVAGPGPSHGPTYYTITGSTLSTTTTGPFLALNTGRTVYIGHPYRVAATGTVTYQGKTATATAHSRTSGP
jgi:hypothetical protein